MWLPQSKSINILEKAMKHLKSVPYVPSARWMFYRLLQDSLYKGKDDYNGKFLPLFSRARKEEYLGWRRNSLIDDTRHPIYQSGEYRTVEEWFSSLAGNQCSLDEWFSQKNYVEVWFEAEAMLQQFKYYTRHVTLRPFKGDISIFHKDKIAKELCYFSRLYHKPIIVLYFGDLDKKGIQIPKSALKDIRIWCGVDFEFIRCGLTLDQAQKYSVPENFEKPGDYQWEGLSDDGAKEIIVSSLSPYLDEGAFENIAEEEKRATERYKKIISQLLEKL